MTGPAASRRERMAWLALLVLALALRLWDLGARAMTHDESLHAYFSFRLMADGVYQHDPVYHGPLLYHVTALVFFLLGHGDALARLAPALTGTAIVAALWCWRRYLGRVGAAVAAALLATSPAWLFYSRHIREDIYAAACTLAWAYALLRYLEGRERRWLIRLTVSMALAFLAKETAFITGAILGSFTLAVARWPGPGGETTREAARDAAVVMLALVLPFAAGPLFLAMGWSPSGPDVLRRLAGAGGLIVAVLVASGLVAGAWRLGARRWLPIYGVFWGLALAFYTTLFTQVSGLGSSVVGSLGYWLTQQEVARAGQPWFYYAIVGALYEPLTLTLGIAGLGLALLALRRPPDAPAVATAGDPGAPSTRLALRLLVWWSAGAVVGYGVAGEKMPWLLIHQLLPLALVAGWGAARVVRAHGEMPALADRLRLALGAAVLLVLAVAVLLGRPFAGRSVEAVADTIAWWARLVALLAAGAWTAAIARRVAARARPQSLAAGAMIPLAAYTLRTGVLVCFVTGELPTELLSYAQAGPDVARVMRTVERIDERLGGHRQVRVALDSELTWPFSWYLRAFTRTTTWDGVPPAADAVDVLLAGTASREAAAPLAAAGFTHERGISYWWPLQDYAALTPREAAAWLLDGGRRRRLAGIVLERDHRIPLREWPARRDFDLYVTQRFDTDDAVPAAPR
ncbi:MAG: TIGR03663 family protein [Vicinamibacterales bacterium]